MQKESIQDRMIELLKEFDSLKDSKACLYALKLKNKNVYINEKNRNQLLVIDEKIKFHEVIVCFNLVGKISII